MMSMKILQAIAIILFSIFVRIYGQCEIRGLSAYGGEYNIGVSWSCEQSHNEFQVTYQIINTCGVYNGSGAPTFDLKTPDWRRHTFVTLFNDFSKWIYANSTYQFTVQSRRQQEGQYVYGSKKSVNYTTGADIYLSANTIKHSLGNRWDDYIKAAWSPFMDQCVPTNEYEYQVFRSDGYIAQSGVTNKTIIEIYDLECETSYRIKVAYRTDHGIMEFWASAGSTGLYYPPERTVQLSASDESSLSFIWDEYQPCNTRNDIEATYEYKLTTGRWETPIYRGSTNDTSVSFTDLKPNQQYRMTVRVNIKSSSGNTRDSSNYNFVSGKTGTGSVPIPGSTKSNVVLYVVVGVGSTGLVILFLMIVFVEILVYTRKSTSNKLLTTDEFDIGNDIEIK